MRAPFPYFGGKSSVAPLVWQAFGTGSGRANAARERIWFSPQCNPL